MAKVDAATLVTEASGLKLHTSTYSQSGYRGVFAVPPSKKRKKPFYVCTKEKGKRKVLGYFDSAVEGAVCCVYYGRSHRREVRQRPLRRGRHFCQRHRRRQCTDRCQ